MQDNICIPYDYVIICEKSAIKMCDFDLANVSMSNINIPIERPYATFYMLAIAMFVLSITVCEILIVEMCMALTLTVRMNQIQL